jgi:hypothetical protein
MALRRSSLPLLVAFVALLGLPGSALAQDPTVPVNTTPATPSAWQTTPYVVTLQSTDVEDPTPRVHWRLGSLGSIFDEATGTQITISTPGVLDFQTQAVDISGNASVWRSETLRIDTVDPTDASNPTTPPAVSGWHLAPTSVEVRAVDITSGVDHVEWSLDGGGVQTGINGSIVPVSTNGQHLLRTRAVDVAGNVSDWTDHVIRVDAVLPTDTTTLPTGWRTTPVDVIVKGVDAHSGIDEVSWVVDGGAPDTATPQGQFTISADGSHTVQTLVRDEAGNESGWAQHTVNIDTTAPTNLTDAPDDWVQAAHVEVNASDAVSGVDRVEWQIDGGPWLHGPSGTLVHFTTTGEYQLRTRARDVAGNVSTAQLENVQIDTVAPANTTAAPSGVSSNPYQRAVTGTDDDSGVATVEWQVDGGSIVSGASGAPVTVTGGGQHTLKTRVIDVAGNASAWRTDTININAALGDNVAPVDITTLGSNTAWNNGPVSVTVDAVDAGSGVTRLEWRRPGEPTQSSTTAATFTIDTEGDNRLETRAYDGIQWSAWRLQHFKVDRSLPVDTTAIPAGWQGSSTFTLAATDAYSGVDEIQYTIDGGPDQVGNPGDPVTVPGDGTYTIVSRVLDNAGHSSAYVTRTLKVDTVNPVNTSAVPGTGWLDNPFELTLSGTDLHLDEMQWRLDGGPIQHGGPAAITEDGEYDLETRAIDEAGNDSGWRLNHVRIDGTAPENTTTAAPTGWRKTPYTVEVTGDDGAGSGVDYIERTIDAGAVSTDPNVTITGDGEHTLRTRIVDLVGHTSDWREEIIKIDTAAPTAGLACSSAADAWSQAVASCTVTANGGLSGLGSATVAGADGGTAAVTNGVAVTVSADGTHTVRLDVVDGAGNAAAATAVVNVDRTAPVAGLSCAAADGKYTCQVDASDGTSGLAYLGWSVDGGAYETIGAGGSFTVAHGDITLHAVDVAGNATVTAPVTLAAIPKNVKVRISSVPVYLKGHKDADSMLGALNAVRSPSGTVSLDLRPLAVGRGSYRVEIRLKSGKHSKRFNRTYKVGRTGALPRISTSLSKATEKTTITLTVRKKSGTRWSKYAGTRLVLKK